MATAARDRLARMLRGDVKSAFSVELTARPDELRLAGALEPSASRITGRQQLSDAYLLGFAITRKGKLVTLDPSVRALLGNQAVEQDRLQRLLQALDLQGIRHEVLR